MTRRQSIIVAVVLWLVFAFVVWNVVFDRILVLAGRRYSHDAVTLYRSSGRYLRIDDVMRPAAARAARVASLAAGAIVTTGLALIAVAVRRDGRTIGRVAAGDTRPDD